jgi:hypothetical protein
VIFASGVSWITLVFTQSFLPALAAGFSPFFVLDLAKVAVAAAVLPTASRWLAAGSSAPRG